MSRVFVNEVNGNEIIVRGEDFNHLARVLRLRVGEGVTACAANGLDYTCEVKSIDADKIILSVKTSAENESEPKTEITLYQALPKGDKLELVIQKCVELGIKEIVLFDSENSVVTYKGKEEKKLERLNKISEAAAKQCGRGHIPNVRGVLSFEDAIHEAESYDLAFIPYEKEEEHSLKSLLRNFNGGTAAYFIGSEGGFSESEIAKTKALQKITLGKRILRTETAGLVVLACMLYELEG